MSTLVLSLVLVAATASAQVKKPAAAPPPGPAMAAEGRKFLDDWLGTWTSNDVVFTMGGQKMPGSFNMTCERVSSGVGTAGIVFDVRSGAAAPQPPVPRQAAIRVTDSANAVAGSHAYAQQ